MKIWLALAALIGTQIAYPLVAGGTRAAVVVSTVLLGFALSVGHAAATRGPRTAAYLVAVTAGGGLAVEALGVATGFPFGSYAYTGALGPSLLGVPVVVPLAWTWMAWPAWLAAGRLAPGCLVRVGVAGLALAAWDLFLDPQMVAAGYWVWPDGTSAHASGAIPVRNYLAWLAVALAMMAVLARTGGARAPARDRRDGRDGPMLALYLWTYYSSVLAHAAFLGLPASAWRGALGMGLVALPLTAVLAAPRWTSAPAAARR